MPGKRGRRSCGDGRYFSTTHAIPEFAEVEINIEEAVELEERQEADLLAPRRRRLRGKQAVSTCASTDGTEDEGLRDGGFLEQLHGEPHYVGGGGDGDPRRGE